MIDDPWKLVAMIHLVTMLWSLSAANIRQLFWFRRMFGRSRGSDFDTDKLKYMPCSLCVKNNKCDCMVEPQIARQTLTVTRKWTSWLWAKLNIHLDFSLLPCTWCPFTVPHMKRIKFIPLKCGKSLPAWGKHFDNSPMWKTHGFPRNMIYKRWVFHIELLVYRMGHHWFFAPAPFVFFLLSPHVHGARAGFNQPTNFDSKNDGEFERQS